MPADLVMPKLGLNMTEGLLAAWQVGPGDAVARGDVLFTVETDKIATEIEAAADGTITEILVSAGTTVPVGTPVARWTGGTGSAAIAEPAVETTPTPPASVPRVDHKPSPGRRIVATPYARRRARDLGVDLASVAGSGPRGRIKAADVERAATKPVRPPPMEVAEAPVATAVEPRAIASAPVSQEETYWIEIDAEAEAALAFLAGTDGIGIDALVVAATACASGGAIVRLDGVSARLFPAKHSWRLSEIGAGTGAELRLPRAGEDAAAVCVARASTRFASGSIANARFSIGIGRPTRRLQPDADGAPVARTEITLTLSTRPSTMPLAEAEATLERIRDIVEKPALLLLGRAG